MRIYEIKLTYNLIQSGPAEALNCAAKVVAYMQGAFDAYPEQEMCYLICLNRKLKPTARIMITLGTQSASLLTPREFYRAAIAASASTVIAVHNHPSGHPGPSHADIQVTRQLRECGRILDIPLEDHIVIGTKEDDPLGLGYFSFREQGLI
ncbi:hypothetical protein AW736_16855 [Termitidicoccus mucosus]|uniref:MPN domain-containing protein n=1 Tax=Termitidicoccus mucosus TaxID=1184151 RepID=A0A178IER8_9BACT|nr:hypothetical protein AW736_16855 [Opitutaceae bacterium TSB47]